MYFIAEMNPNHWEESYLLTLEIVDQIPTQIVQADLEYSQEGSLVLPL